VTPTASPLTIVEVPIDDLRPDPANPRKISEPQLEVLTRNIQKNGFLQPLVARQEDSLIIAGHQRLKAAIRLGFKEVPVVWVEGLSIEESRLLNVSLNQIGGEFDTEMLAHLLADLPDELDLSLSGFADDEVSKLLKSLEHREKRERQESFDLDAALEARAAPRAQRGELWALGDHRLLSGDACDTADVTRLFDGKQAAMCFTDPPYNVSLGDHGGQQRGAKNVASRTTPCRLRSGSPSAGAGPATFSPRSMVPSTSACPPRSGH